jgi:hypothetical protein
MLETDDGMTLRRKANDGEISIYKLKSDLLGYQVLTEKKTVKYEEYIKDYE